MRAFCLVAPTLHRSGKGLAEELAGGAVPAFLDDAFADQVLELGQRNLTMAHRIVGEAEDRVHPSLKRLVLEVGELAQVVRACPAGRTSCLPKWD